MNYGISRHIDHFSCEGEARVRLGKGSFMDILNDAIGGISDILKGYEPTGKTNGYILGTSKMEHRASDSFELNHMRETIGAD
jgi:hypothetical protein